MKKAHELRIGSPQEPPLGASKWLQLQILADADEMRRLIAALGDFHIFMAGVVCAANEGEISKEHFLTLYEQYVSALQNGQLPDEGLYRQAFSSIFTTSTDDLFQVDIPGNRRVIRIARPVLQLQLHKIAYSPVDGKFRPMGIGKDCIFWGLQFSYPQLYQDVQKEVHKALDESQFPNALLYRRLQQWVRQETIPTPFITELEQVNVPMRLGKNCLSWINMHPQLIAKRIRVA